MDFESTSDRRSSPIKAPPPEGPLNKIFLNEAGLRSGWRLLIYSGFVLGLGFAAEFILPEFVRPRSSGSFLGFWFPYEILSFGAAFAAALIMARIEHRVPDVYGLPLRGAFGKLFWQGCLLGLIEVSGLVGLIAVCGGYSFGNLALHGIVLLRWGILWGILFVFVGLFEEFLFRGYTLYTLADGIGFWPAAVILSVLFGRVHLSNRGENWVGAAGVVVIGLVFAFALRRTGNLWLAVGWHASFDFGETFLFSVPNSGLTFENHLSNASLHGARWLTGGSVGPEASIFSFLTMGVLALVIHFLYPARKANHAQG